jgi:hypothetical protein
MDKLYLVKSDEKGERYLIGELSKEDNEYTFRYTPIAPGKSDGFIKVHTFKDFSKVYKSNDLFFFFTSRLFDRRRPDLPKLLEQYGLEQYDEWELLKATKGRLMIDSYELMASFPQ